MNFYHWKSSLSLSATEKQYLNGLGTQKIYLRFFDLKVKEGQPYPEAILQAQGYGGNWQLIPTVYITNAALLATAESDLGALADNMLLKITEIWQQALGQKGVPAALQMDCDWTAQTGRKYFRLLELLKAKGAFQELSSTLRLHQVKYRETAGIPPADKVVLMFYNMGQLDNPREKNSILNLEIGEQYLERLKDYPLPMEVALPVFQWGVQIRAGKVMQLLNNFSPEEGLEKGILETEAENQYRVAKSGYLAGTYLYRGDLIRLERASTAQLEQAIEILREANPESFDLVLYHLDEAMLKRYPLPQLKEILTP